MNILTASSDSYKSKVLVSLHKINQKSKRPRFKVKKNINSLEAFEDNLKKDIAQFRVKNNKKVIFN